MIQQTPIPQPTNSTSKAITSEETILKKLHPLHLKKMVEVYHQMLRRLVFTRGRTGEIHITKLHLPLQMTQFSCGIISNHYQNTQVTQKNVMLYFMACSVIIYYQRNLSIFRTQIFYPQRLALACCYIFLVSQVLFHVI